MVITTFEDFISIVWRCFCTGRCEFCCSNLLRISFSFSSCWVMILNSTLQFCVITDCPRSIRSKSGLGICCNCCSRCLNLASSVGRLVSVGFVVFCKLSNFWRILWRICFISSNMTGMMFWFWLMGLWCYGFFKLAADSSFLLFLALHPSPKFLFIGIISRMGLEQTTEQTTN